jgi:DNA-binding IclR family transcriptional regulator
VALGDEPYRGLDDSEAHRALKALERAGFVERITRGNWKIFNPLLKRYLADLDPVGPIP